jgi:hypothetical protein
MLIEIFLREKKYFIIDAGVNHKQNSPLLTEILGIYMWYNFMS